MFHLFRRLRCVHALEHATLHLLPRQAVRGHLLGRSDPLGFTLYGDADTAAIGTAANEALVRLQHGQPQLAVHPHCGTNLAVSALLVFVAGWLLLKGRPGVGRRGLAAALMVTAMGASQPLGSWAQAHITTNADVAGLQVEAPVRREHGSSVSHRVNVREG